MDKKTKEIMLDIIGLIESIDLDHLPHSYFDDYTLKIDKEKMSKIKEKISQLTT